MSKYQIRYSNVSDEDVGFGEILGDISVQEYAYYNATLEEEINTAGVLTFTILPSNPALPNLALRATTIMLYRDGTEIWRGRIVRTEVDMLNRRVLTCEGVLAWFYDVLSKGFPPHLGPVGSEGNTPSILISDILNFYNNNCSKNRRLDWSTSSGPTREWYPQIEDEYVTVFDLLSQLLANSGGYYGITYDSNERPVFNYLNYPTAPTGQEIRFGQNLFDVARVIDAANVVTTLYAEDSAGHTFTVEDTEMETAFGISQAYQYFGECTSASELQSLARAWFNNNCLSQTTINLSALDLNLTNAAYESFYVGQGVRIISPPHGIDTMMILTGLQTNLSNPEASQITLGAVPRGLTNYIAQGTGSGVGGASGGSASGGSEMWVTTITPTITQTSGNSTMSVTAARKYGKVIQMGFNFSITGNVAEGENIWSGTLSNYQPVAYISTASYYGVATPSAGVLRITAAGDINFRLVKGALASGNTMYAGLTYITEK